MKKWGQIHSKNQVGQALNDAQGSRDSQVYSNCICFVWGIKLTGSYQHIISSSDQVTKFYLAKRQRWFIKTSSALGQEFSNMLIMMWKFKTNKVKYSQVYLYTCICFFLAIQGLSKRSRRATTDHFISRRSECTGSEICRCFPIASVFVWEKERETITLSRERDRDGFPLNALDQTITYTMHLIKPTYHIHISIYIHIYIYINILQNILYTYLHIFS